MSVLSTPLRKQLEKCIREARIVAEDAAADSIRRMAVAPPDPPAGISAEHKALRVRLRAHGRTLGDTLDAKRVQTTVRLQEAAAYEIWHRMLFGRFLVERGLLLHPTLGAPLTLKELDELAPDEGATDAWALAERYAAATLPAVFKPDDPVLALPLDPYHHKQLQGLVTGLDAEVFEASDSLGWTYQFWRAAEKEAINQAGGKIGAAELPAVTQLFTEPYMVRFLLHNTLGAWWAGKVLSANPDLARNATNEEPLRTACALPEIEWEYLRFVRDPADNGPWRPAAGTYPGWPEKAAAITLLDPCCGSGHFLVEALPILAAIRRTEEGLTVNEAVRAVLQDNLHGLEIDGRCVQIAAFTVALAAWRIGGWQKLPLPRIAWVGAPPPLPRAEFVALADGEKDFERALAALHDLFAQAPILGSLLQTTSGDLVDPKRIARIEDLLESLLAKARQVEPEHEEGVIAARGMADAAALLHAKFTLVATNVPYLGIAKHNPVLLEFIATNFPEAKYDLALAFLERIRSWLNQGGCSATVSLGEWLYLGPYTEYRDKFLETNYPLVVFRLGWNAFSSPIRANPALVIASTDRDDFPNFVLADCSSNRTFAENLAAVRNVKCTLTSKKLIRRNPDRRFIVEALVDLAPLSKYAEARSGLHAGDLHQFFRMFWEVNEFSSVWEPVQTAVNETTKFAGREQIIRWENERGSLFELAESVKHLNHAAQNWRAGKPFWGKNGVIVGLMGNAACALYSGQRYDVNSSAIIPKSSDDLASLWCFCESGEFSKQVRAIDNSLKLAPKTLLKVGFDLSYWQGIAHEEYPNGLPDPHSDDPTQWIFHGHPAHAVSGTQLHVALVRLAGYRWPAEADAAMHLAPEARNLIAMAATLPPPDADGLLPLQAQGLNVGLADRLREFLAAVFGSRWSNALEADLVREADAALDKKSGDANLDSWLRERAFRQHCTLFHDRPFLWQVTDGIRGGFSAFLHYHRLDYAKLEKLTYTVLGDWLARARDEGQTARAERARALQQKLEFILAGKEPYDIFVRWKPLAAQPLGWEPDLNDGVRQNIRPFIMAEVLTHDLSKILKDKDRGNDVDSAPWYPLFHGERRNDHHTSLADKQAAREQR